MGGQIVAQGRTGGRRRSGQVGGQMVPHGRTGGSSGDGLVGAGRGRVALVGWSALSCPTTPRATEARTRTASIAPPATAATISTRSGRTLTGDLHSGWAGVRAGVPGRGGRTRRG